MTPPPPGEPTRLAALRQLANRARLPLTDEELEALAPLVEKYEADRDAIERFLASEPDPVRFPIPGR